MKTITINGKTYPCRVTMGALLRFKRETGHDISQIGETDVEALITLLWCCVASASKADGVEFGMSLMDFADLLSSDTLTRWEEGLNTSTGLGTEAEKKTVEQPMS